VQYVRMQGVRRKTTWGYSIYGMGIYGVTVS
jgi:hyaluronoglucosaminidase